ncbi:MAG: DUF4034 domain-containing protein, partial [Candidatus Hydrogenedentes bacterium]|nr:DUF4034 domain-containing protein [Candidatus Hydrogenedentota bacterium]
MMHRTRQFVVIAMLIAGSAVAATIEVAPGSSIQQAVAAAAPGDTVSVAPGTYREQIQLKDGVTIVGADRATVIVEWPGDKGSTLIIRDCPGGAVRRVTFRHVPLAESEQPKDGFDVVWISDSSAEVSDCVISGGTANGLQIRGKGAPVIANCVIEKNRQYGIALVGIVTTPAITGNRIAANSGSGLGVFEAVPRSHAKIEDNVITDNSGYGIWMDGKSWVDVKGNDFTKNGQICKFEIETLFQAKKFDMLETIAARLRRDKARYPAGGWQLQWFYDFLSARAWTMGPEDMAREEQTIAEWQKAHPGSITWRVVLVNNYIRQAWKSRGGGYAREVTPEAWAGYREGMRKAWAVMDEAAAIEPKDAEYYVMLCVLSMESPRDTVSPGLWSFLSDAVSTLLGAGAKDAAARAFDEGVKHEPLYLRFYEERSRQLLPRWHGSVSQMMAFADRSAADIGGADGDAMYAVIASAVLKSESDETFLGSYSFSWEQIQRGYDALLKQFPASNYFRNQCLRMAGVYR